VAFPDESLSPGEEVKLHLHPHWIVMFWPTFWTVVTFGSVIFAALTLTFTAGQTNLAFIAIFVVAIVLWLWLAFAPFVVWRSTHYVFTTKQVLFREGIIKREERGIPLAKVNDVKSTQNLLERLLGCGTLTVESAGEKGQSVLDDIPQVVKVMNTLKDLVENDSDKRSLDEDELRAALKEHRESGGTL
jgi:uncharacterized membrane protein YdbT with pleckstrin-like domain